MPEGMEHPVRDAGSLAHLAQYDPKLCGFISIQKIGERQNSNTSDINSTLNVRL